MQMMSSFKSLKGDKIIENLRTRVSSDNVAYNANKNVLCFSTNRKVTFLRIVTDELVVTSVVGLATSNEIVA